MNFLLVKSKGHQQDDMFFSEYGTALRRCGWFHISIPLLLLLLISLSKIPRDFP